MLRILITSRGKTQSSALFASGNKGVGKQELCHLDLGPSGHIGTGSPGLGYLRCWMEKEKQGIVVAGPAMKLCCLLHGNRVTAEGKV